jgi:hypothetical protein
MTKKKPTLSPLNGLASAVNTSQNSDAQFYEVYKKQVKQLHGLDLPQNPVPTTIGHHPGYQITYTTPQKETTYFRWVTVANTRYELTYRTLHNSHQPDPVLADFQHLQDGLELR